MDRKIRERPISSFTDLVYRLVGLKVNSNLPPGHRPSPSVRNGLEDILRELLEQHDPPDNGPEPPVEQQAAVAVLPAPRPFTKVTTRPLAATK